MRQDVGVRIRNLVVPGKQYWDERILKIITMAKMYGTDVKEMEYGTELKEGEMKFTCLGPGGNTDDKSHNVTTGNESSMILHLEYGEFDMLFTGDVEKEGEERLTEVLDVIQEEKKITWEILKTAHHGSKILQRRHSFRQFIRSMHGYQQGERTVTDIRMI